MHVVDAQSPARVEFLDRYDDAIPDGPLIAAYRPHEFLSAHVVDTMAATVRGLGAGPVSKQSSAFAISTGDAVDNCQQNELRWTIDLLDGGGSIRADSGDLSKWEGVADGDARYYDTHYWHPDGPPTGKPEDLPISKYGFPKVPGLLDAVRRPFTATGLGMPWYRGLRKPRRPDPGQRTARRRVLQDLHRQHQDHWTARRGQRPRIRRRPAGREAATRGPSGADGHGGPQAQGLRAGGDDRRPFHDDRHPGRPRIHRREPHRPATRTTRSTPLTRCWASCWTP